MSQNMERRSLCGSTWLIFTVIIALLLAVPVVILFLMEFFSNVSTIAIPCLVLALTAIVLESVFAFRAGCHCCIRRYATLITLAAAVLFALAASVVGTVVVPGAVTGIFMYLAAASLFTVLLGLTVQVECLSR